MTITPITHHRKPGQASTACGINVANARSLCVTDSRTDTTCPNCVTKVPIAVGQVWALSEGRSVTVLCLPDDNEVVGVMLTEHGRQRVTTMHYNEFIKLKVIEQPPAVRPLLPDYPEYVYINGYAEGRLGQAYRDAISASSSLQGGRVALIIYKRVVVEDRRLP